MINIPYTYTYIKSHKRTVRVYDAATGEERKALFFSGNVEAMAWVEVEEDEKEEDGG